MTEAIYFEDGKQTTKNLDLVLSVKLSDWAMNGKCYQNSQKVMQLVDKSSAYYVEGYAIFYNEKIFNLWHHGWVELNGEIIDNYPGMWERYRIMYFVGKRYTMEEAMTINKYPLKVHWKELLFAIKTYHKAIYENSFWLPTAAKLALLFITSRG